MNPELKNTEENKINNLKELLKNFPYPVSVSKFLK